MPILGLSPAWKSTHPPHFDIERVIRPNILALQPYRAARDDYSSGILLDANENSLGHSIASSSQLPSSADLDSILKEDLHRYPDPSQPQIKQRIADLRGLPSTDYVFLGVGSDEVIDLLMRVCVAPGAQGEKILTTPPTYGMYAVCAQVNDVGIVKVDLELGGEHGEGKERGRFSVRVDEVKRAVDEDPSIKLLFLCSPGNPTGTLISLASIRAILDYEPFKGIVIVDEAYIDFSEPGSSAVSLISEYANLCVMQTLSKSYGLAAIRLGIALAQPPLIQILTNTKAPYNISTPTASLALRALSPESSQIMHVNIAKLREQGGSLRTALQALAPLGVGKEIGSGDANFLLVPILAREGNQPDNGRAVKVYKALAEEEGVVVRFRGGEKGCTGCLRITVGTEEENAFLLEKLRKVLQII
ncbi:histidinol-phosphate aminotransferase [Auriscalpium vulgare]|uniref:Histidinol-phosphate aminotransferase n=1 Tax=Auriscalpium vulgare TaxID=40419 RepID=A0ACB8SBC2_9AGAM|nr:histidinol-phosphate aminotransferase [Auriscalpium vulgare]